MPGGNIKEFSLSFVTQNPYTKHQLRELLIKSAHELLNAINNNEKVRPHLEKYPFTEANVGIEIFNREKDGRSLVDPHITVAEISYGILTYASRDPDNKFRYKNEYSETLEEALKLVQSHP